MLVIAISVDVAVVVEASMVVVETSEVVLEMADEVDVT